VRTVHGLVTGFGRSDNDDHAVESATAKALGDISESAQAMGANAVVDVGIAVSGRKSKIVVTAWGTAVSFSLDPPVMVGGGVGLAREMPPDLGR
jgi:uncharacterized protein YbjQ (UPF0145 family)